MLRLGGSLRDLNLAYFVGNPFPNYLYGHRCGRRLGLGNSGFEYSGFAWPLAGGEGVQYST